VILPRYNFLEEKALINKVTTTFQEIRFFCHVFDLTIETRTISHGVGQELNQDSIFKVFFACGGKILRHVKFCSPTEKGTEKPQKFTILGRRRFKCDIASIKHILKLSYFAAAGQTFLVFFSRIETKR
jgi:hypothetical protein